MKKEKIKKILTEEKSSALSAAQQTLIKSVEKFLPTFDKDFAQFTVCSALSLNSDRFYNNYSMCCLLQGTRKNKKDGKVLSASELASEDYLYIGIVAGLLGSKIIYN